MLIKIFTSAESGNAAIWLVIVVLKLASSPIAAANSFNVLRAPGAASITAFTLESIIDSIVAESSILGAPVKEE